jgi:hypothetical protein
MRHKIDTNLRYPGLWRGCIGAWAPCLGPTGLSLRDWSGFGNHGVLTSGPTFAASQCRYALNLDGVNDSVVCRAITLNNFSVSIWVRHTGANANSDAISNRIGGAGGTAPGVIIGAAGASGQWWYFVDSGSAYMARYASVRTSLFANSIWYHHAMSWNQVSAELTVYLNGVNITSSLTAIGSGSVGSVSSSQALTIGARPVLTDRTLSGELDDIMIHNRVVSANEVKLLASRRGIAYEMATRRRSVTVGATFNRRRRLLIGAH